MSYCCVPKCKSNAKHKVPGISFHEIPCDAEVREEWLRRIPRKDWVPNTTSRYSVVCSKHFLPGDFKEGCKIRMLKKGAIPSLFDVPPSECVQPPAKRAPGAARKRDATKSHPDPVASRPPSVVGRATVRSTGDNSSSRHPIQSTASSMVCCAIPGCGSQAGVTRDVVLHEFPSNVERRELWTLVVRALRPPCRDYDDPWVPSEYARICSKHFTPDDYIQGPKKRYLAPHATPTRFLEACDGQTPGCRGLPRKQRRAKDSSSTVVVNESPSEVESSERPPTSTTTTPVVIRHLFGDSSHSKRDHQGAADSVSMRISNVVSTKHAEVRLSAETLEPSENADPHVRLSAVTLAGSCDRQTPDVVPLLGSRAVVLSVGCQTHVTGLTIEAYEEQIHLLKNECKKLRGELCELRCLSVNTMCGGSVTSKKLTNMNANI
uniref:Transposase protein n=1 Tax=Rhipicephalus zambeziensis TaxID=60191 RepID=A0A224Z483_9ACAR